LYHDPSERLQTSRTNSSTNPSKNNNNNNLAFFHQVKGIQFLNLADLMLRIKQARLLLNGKHQDRSKATFASGFKFTRYAILLLAATIKRRILRFLTLFSIFYRM
jgi:hypothetical protein